MQQLGNQTIGKAIKNYLLHSDTNFDIIKVEQDSSDDKYDTIKYYLERFRSVSFEKVNLFAIVTYIQISGKKI